MACQTEHISDLCHIVHQASGSGANLGCWFLQCKASTDNEAVLLLSDMVSNSSFTHLASLSWHPSSLGSHLGSGEQVSERGITHLGFHPGSDRLLLATGDKGGNIGIWNVNHHPLSSSGAHIITDALLQNEQRMYRTSRGCTQTRADLQNPDLGEHAIAW